jgi:hypothetical protein
VVNVCFAGVTGWTAPPIIAAIDVAEDLILTCGVSRSAAGRTLADATGSGSDGLIYGSVSEALQSARLYPLLDHIVLLTIPVAAAKRRLASRTTNDYGKDPAELRRELQLRTVVEPLLRRSACLEIDTSIHPLSAVVTMITNHVMAGHCAAVRSTGQDESQRPS